MNEEGRIIKLETQMDNIEKKVDDGFRRMEKKMDDFITKSQDTFASKWVEKAVWGVCAVVGGSIVLAVLSKIIHP